MTVASGATISATVHVDLSYNSSWDSTDWRIGNTGNYTCVNTANHTDYNSATTYYETFDITAPTTPGTYSVTFHTYDGSNSCAGSSSATITLNNAVTVSKLNQATLTITGPASKTVGDAAFAPTTSGGSGTGAVTFNSSTSPVCTASGSATVTIVAAGTCTVTATKAGDSTYNSKTSAPFDITINAAKINQATLTITGPASKTVGDADFAPATSGGSGGGALTFDSSTTSVCTASGSAIVAIIMPQAPAPSRQPRPGTARTTRRRRPRLASPSIRRYPARPSPATGALIGTRPRP